MFTCDVTKACSFAGTSLTVNYRILIHSDILYRYNGENDNVVLKFPIGKKQVFL